MSKDNTNFDVRIALYEASKKNIANIIFFNETELLLECNRVTLVRDGDRLYFHKGDGIVGSVKFSTPYKDKLQLWKDYSKVRDLEGRYDLKYDKDHDMYYIDKSEKLSEDDLSRRGTIKGTKQLNHNSGKREKKGETIVAPIKITPKGKQVVEVAKTQKKETSKNVVVQALIALLRTQVDGNADALSTIDALEKFI